MYNIIVKEPTMKESQFRKLIREELKDYINEESEEGNTLKNLIANFYQFIIRSDINAAKQKLKNNPELQRMATDIKRESDFIASELLKDKSFIEFKDPSFLQSYTPNPGVFGAPKYYSVFDVSNFLLAPTPDVGYIAELHYLYRPDSLTAGAGGGTTWLSLNAELALLYGSLVEAYIYMKGEQDVMAMYNARLQEAIMGIKLLGEAKETTQDYRVGKVIREKQ